MKYFYKIEDEKLFKGSGFKIPQGMIEYIEGKEPQELKDFLILEELENKNNQTKSSLMQLCSNKRKEIKSTILGYKGTPDQIESYIDKYDQAKEGLFSTDENEAIILNHEAYLTTIRNFNNLLELFRTQCDDLIIANELDKANLVIEKAKLFDETTTPEMINSLFTGTE